MDVQDLLRRAAAEGISSLLIEGGGTLGGKLHPRWSCGRNRLVCGADPDWRGWLASPGGLGLQTLSDATRWKPVATERIGDDVLNTYVRF
jgi:diaminohydroxyphosphoribosylaminopyrimidine deaminase/5-amino-6-(5-phosphoribosylamino)uracil reductase